MMTHNMAVQYCLRERRAYEQWLEFDDSPPSQMIHPPLTWRIELHGDVTATYRVATDSTLKALLDRLRSHNPNILAGTHVQMYHPDNPDHDIVATAPKLRTPLAQLGITTHTTLLVRLPWNQHRQVEIPTYADCVPVYNHLEQFYECCGVGNDSAALTAVASALSGAVALQRCTTIASLGSALMSTIRPPTSSTVTTPLCEVPPLAPSSASSSEEQAPPVTELPTAGATPTAIMAACTTMATLRQVDEPQHDSPPSELPPEPDRPAVAPMDDPDAHMEEIQ